MSNVFLEMKDSYKAPDDVACMISKINFKFNIDSIKLESSAQRVRLEKGAEAMCLTYEMIEDYSEGYIFNIISEWIDNFIYLED